MFASIATCQNGRMIDPTMAAPLNPKIQKNVIKNTTTIVPQRVSLNAPCNGLSILVKSLIKSKPTTYRKSKTTTA